MNDATKNSNARGILIGALIGAMLGAAIAWAYTSGSDRGGYPELKPGDYFRLGITLLGVARQVGDVVQRV